MNSVATVGLPGPAPPATRTSQSVDADATEATPFADVLHKVRPTGPPSTSTDGDASEPEPGALDLETLIQLLLGGEAPPGDQTATELKAQLDRLAGAGTNEIKDTGLPVDEEMLVALMAQLAVPVVDTELGVPVVALPVVDAQTQQAAAGAMTSSPVGIEVPTTSADQVGAAVLPVNDVPDAPVVPVTAPLAAEAPQSEVAPVAVPEVEQQQALPLTSGSTDETAPIAPPATAGVEVEVVEEPAPIEVETATAELTSDEPGIDQALPETTLPDDLASTTRELATDVADVRVDASVVPVTSPATSSTRSTSPVTATDAAAATTAGNEVFTAELANTVQRASLLGDQEVRLLLNPPDLGHLDVRIVESPQGVRVVLEATTTEARELIEQQLPGLRAALESRNLRVDRLQVEQALDASSVEQQFERGLRQDGQPGGNQSGQPDQDAAPWSPVASMRSDASNGPAGMGAVSETKSAARTATGDGRLDLMA